MGWDRVVLAHKRSGGTDRRCGGVEGTGIEWETLGGMDGGEGRGIGWRRLLGSDAGGRWR